MTIHCRSSKTHQFGRGIKPAISTKTAAHMSGFFGGDERVIGITRGGFDKRSYVSGASLATETSALGQQVLMNAMN